MLQLGLLRVVTWPGSWFKKQRIKAQILFVPTRSSWCSSILNSADRALDLVASLLWFSGDGSNIDDLSWLGSHFLLRVCETSFLIFVIPFFFAWTISFLELQSAGCPSFISLFYRFWLFGLFVYDFFFLITTACLHDCFEPSLFFRKDLFGAIRHALGSTEKTTLPWVMIKGFNFRK